jgi:hypothetical protein
MKDESKKIDVSRRAAAQWGEISFKVAFSFFYTPAISHIFE